MQNHKNIRDNLLVTMGARAAYMECKKLITLPGGSVGEDILAEFVSYVVDAYRVDEDTDLSFDEYIETALLKQFPYTENEVCERSLKMMNHPVNLEERVEELENEVIQLKATIVDMGEVIMEINDIIKAISSCLDIQARINRIRV